MDWLKPKNTMRPTVGSHEVGQSGEHRVQKVGDGAAMARAGYSTVDQCPLGARDETPMTRPARGFGDMDYDYSDDY